MAAGKKYYEPVYIEEEMNEKYMEGNYDGDADQRYKQERADKRRSVEIGEEIRASQEAVYERETERLSYEYSAVGSEFEKIMKAYIKENEYQQYLVDGAVLRCTQAMTDDVVFTEWGEKVILENKADEVCNIILNVPENPVYEDDDSENAMMINGLRYATVKDTIKNVNIIVPKCNCRLAADRDEEEKRIRNDTDRNKNGVCMHLMRLNEEWDNFEVKDKDGFRIEYAKRVNVAPSPFSAGAGRMLDGSEDVVEEKIEGITMTSVLFCKHGGLIIPVTSGQSVDIEQEDVGLESEVGNEILEQYTNDGRYQRLLAEAERRKGKIEEYKLQFVLEIFPLILIDEKQSGIPAEITFAQMCLESSYGTSTCVDINTGINGNNYFGIKGKGPAGSVTCRTKEEIEGNMVSVKADFKAYNSMSESIEDHSDLLVNNYQQYTVTGSVEDWCDALKIGKYATASNYKEQILGVCRTWKIIE